MKYNEMTIPTSTIEYVYTLINNRDENIYREIVKVAYEKKF